MFKDKVKALISKQSEGNSKKKVENLVVCILILVITVIAINAIWGGKKTSSGKGNTQEDYGKQLATVPETTNTNTVSSNTSSIEQNLESILSKIDGVGNVKVLVTYAQSSEVVAMYNENNKNSSIEEKDSGGGTRVTEQNDTSKEVIYKEVEGEKVPITQKIINPKVEGAIITAVGASNATLKNNIIQAVEAVTGLATHKIQVFEMKKE